MFPQKIDLQGFASFYLENTILATSATIFSNERQIFELFDRS